MSVISVVEKFFADTSRNDLAGAVVAGVAAGALQSLMGSLFRHLSFWAAARPIVIGLAVYLSVGFLLQRFWRNRLAPNWFLTSLFGTILFVAALLGPAIISGWFDPHNVYRSLMDYLSPELDSAGSGVILLLFVTLPITASFHYSREMTRAVKKWHAGSEPTSLRGE